MYALTPPPRGFTLLEALIAMVVISVGLLGVLGLQALSLASTHISATRSVATTLAEDMAERMRANPAGAAANHYAKLGNGAGATKMVDCADHACTPAQMASYDALAWKRALAAALPTGRGRVTCLDQWPADTDACSPGSAYTITVIWSEPDRRAAAADQCPDPGITRRCFQTRLLP